MTVLDVITRALQIIGTLSVGQIPSADDAAVGLSNLNELLDGWNTELLNLYTTTVFTGNLINTQQSYAMGPSAADFNTLSPIMIKSAHVIIPATSVRLPVSILSAVEWADLNEKGLTGFRPDKLYCDYAFPIANLNVHPIPNQTIALQIYLWSILAQFAAITDTVSFRPGYQEALQYNLAVKLAPQFGVAQDGTNVQLAGSYKQRMQELNALAGFPVPAQQQAARPQQGAAPQQ